MFYGIKRAKSKLSDRLTGVYTLLFAVILFVLSAGVFFFAFQFLIQKQSSNLSVTAELISDHLVEEIEENEPLSSPEILEEQNNDQYLSIFVYDSAGNLVNRLLNFPVVESQLPASAATPTLVFQDGRMQLCVSRPIREHDEVFGNLTIVQELHSETGFLQLLRLLLIGANLIGALAAIGVGNYTSRKMLSPIIQMIENTNQIGASNLEARLDVPEPVRRTESTCAHHQQYAGARFNRLPPAGRFVADVIHELRTPLAVMQGQRGSSLTLVYRRQSRSAGQAFRRCRNRRRT
jgi:signal transduction histidine kinase